MRTAELGTRICIMGPSCSGKSTLAAALGTRLDLPVVSLDLLHHLPQTDWKPRRQADFLALHAKAIQQDRWVMEGNYSVCLPERLQRATGFILLDSSTPASLFRYLRRTLLQSHRAGGLPGNRDRVKFAMLWHLAVVTPGNRRRYSEMFQNLALPKVRFSSFRAIQAWESEFRPRKSSAPMGDT